MKNFTSYEKLSKKAQKAINDERRGAWGMNPTTRIAPNRKGFRKADRAAAKAALRCGF